MTTSIHSRLRPVVSAELHKLRTLPTAVLTAIGTVLSGAVIAAILNGSAAGADAPASATTVVRQGVPLIQVGLILLGILPAAHEYAGSQIRTTLIAVPNRLVLTMGKTLAALATATLTATAAVGASVLIAWAGLHAQDVERLTDADVLTAAGAVVYLVLIALLSHAVALLVRALVATLVGMLSLVLIVSPLLSGLTEHARWLPDQAGAQLYGGTDTVLGPTTGALVLLTWVIAVATTGTVSLVRRDA